jgi:hypothetical protein
MPGDVGDVEGGRPRGELDDLLLALLLLRHLLRADLDAGELGELLLMLLEEIAARVLGVQHLDRLALEAAPVECLLPEGRHTEPGRGGERCCAGAGLEELATIDLRQSSFTAASHHPPLRCRIVPAVREAPGGGLERLNYNKREGTSTRAHRRPSGVETMERGTPGGTNSARILPIPQRRRLRGEPAGRAIARRRNGQPRPKRGHNGPAGG